MKLYFKIFNYLFHKLKCCFYICIINMIINLITFKIMKEKMQKMVFKYQYDRLPMDDKLKLRDEFLSKSGMSLITFYDKMRKDTFKPLEKELLEKLFNDKQFN